MDDIATYFPPIPTKWLRRLAKVGLAAKGVFYFLLGLLALMAALGFGEAPSDVDRKAVLLLIEELFLGRVLLGLMTLGLTCYCAWRLLQAALDTQRKGSGTKGIAYRLRYAASGSLYGLLALVSAKLVLSDGNGNSSLKNTVIGAVLQRQLGQWLVGMAAVAVALVGVYFIYQGLSGRYKKKIKEAKVRDSGKKAMVRAGKAGYVARGTVWVLVGYLLLRAALDAKSVGVGNAFRFMESGTHGAYILGGVALGLVCYSLFVFVQAWFWESDKEA